MEKNACWTALLDEYQVATDARQRFRRQGNTVSHVYYTASDSRRHELRARHVEVDDDKPTWTGPFGMKGRVDNRLEHRGPTIRHRRPF